MRVLAKKQEIWCQLLVFDIQRPILRLNRQRLRKNFLLIIPGLLIINHAKVSEIHFFINQGVHFSIQKNLRTNA
jgi:hypothetical protein